MCQSDVCRRNTSAKDTKVGLMDLAIEPLGKQATSATDLVFDALYEAVVSAKLPPGSKVSEAEIARQLGVSRQPVRDAFFRLSDLGLLSIRPQRATVITQISLRAVSNAVFTRTALEVACVRAAMAAAPEVLVADLESHLARQADARTIDRHEFHALDEAFHECICSVAGHAHVWSLIRAQKAHLDRIRFLTLSEKRQGLVVDEHAAIVSAIRAQDVALAEQRLRAHIADVLREAPLIKERHGAYFEQGR